VVETTRLETLEVTANGVRFSALACGRGPLALCAHGFPETAETFDRTLPHLAGLGYRAVAPHMRGYWPTAILEGPRSFHTVDLGHDLVALADALSPGQPVTLVGHDWGAEAVYRAAALRPDRFRALVTVGIPPIPAVRRTLRIAWALRHFVAFQLRDRTVRKFRADGFAFVDALYRRWAPTWSFGPEETAPVKEAFRQPGCLEAALAYYWHFMRPVDPSHGPRAVELMRVPLPMPLTVVLGTHDIGLTPGSIRPRPRRYPRMEVVWIEGAGHFAHREKPEEFLAVLTRVLGTPGGATS
jgi:pimeloyl-ACP methyl ester carboxylesterase